MPLKIGEEGKAKAQDIDHEACAIERQQKHARNRERQPDEPPAAGEAKGRHAQRTQKLDGDDEAERHPHDGDVESGRHRRDGRPKRQGEKEILPPVAARIRAHDDGKNDRCPAKPSPAGGERSIGQHGRLGQSRADLHDDHRGDRHEGGKARLGSG